MEATGPDSTPYNPRIDRTLDVYLGHHGSPTFQRHLRDRVHWTCRQARGRRVLDVGCSQGIVSLLLAREGFEVVGVDVEPSAIEHARQALSQEAPDVATRIQLITGDFADVDLPWSSVDTIVIGEVLEHLAQPERIVRRCLELLVEGGRLVITVPFGIHPHPDHRFVFHLSNLLEIIGDRLVVDDLHLVHTPAANSTPVPILGVVLHRSDTPVAPDAATLRYWLQFSDECFDKTEERYRSLIENLERQRTTLSDQVTALKAAQRTASAEHDTLAKKFEALTGRHQLLSEQSAQLANTRNERDRRLTDLQNRAQAAETQLLELRATSTVAQHQLEHAWALHEQTQATWQATQKALAVELEGLKREHQHALDRISELNRRNATAEASLNEQLESLVEARKAMVAEAGRQTATIEALQRQLEQGAQASVAAAHAEIQRVTDEAQQVRARLASELASRDVEGKLLRTKVEDLQRAASTERRALLFEIRVWMQSEAALRRSIAQRDSIIVWLRQRVATLEDSNSRYFGQLVMRILRRPYLILLFPYYFFMFLYRAARRAWLRRKGRLTRRLAPLKTTVTPIRERPSPRFIDDNGVPILSSQQHAPAASTTSGPPPAGVTTAAPARSPLPSRPAFENGSVEMADAIQALALAGLYEHPRRVSDLKVAAILDEFSTSCFAPECRLITFRPDNWEWILSREQPHFLLVESAWKGNGGSWEYRVARYDYPGREELERQVAWCRDRGIATAFWNKEDPVHFARFLPSAELFDVVFTSDADCIPAYVKELGHDRVYALPFAAQPRLHNPTRVPDYRAGNVCFAGSYYANRHPQRRQELEWLLDAALEYGLIIYDRNHGQASADFRFPERFAAAVAGSLPYDRVIQAYKQYRVFLNVNSVIASPTMFSRRVFELLACGTPVVSTPARGISRLLGADAVALVDSKAKAGVAISRLLSDSDHWNQASLDGQRLIHREHTYAHRLQTVAERLGYDLALDPTPPISAICAVDGSSERLSHLLEMLEAQVLRPDELVLVGPDANLAAPPASAKEVPFRMVSVPTQGHASAGDAFDQALKRASGELIAPLTLDDHYGPHYFEDLQRAMAQVDCDIVGKSSHWRTRDASVQLVDRGDEHSFVGALLPAASILRRKCFAIAPLPAASAWHDPEQFAAYAQAGLRLYASDRFNYMMGSQQSHHEIDR